jgi:biopolymer transport protein ExbB
MGEALGMLQQGGWPMIPLVVFSVLGLGIVLERFFALRRGAVIDVRVVKMVEEFAPDTPPERALVVCRQAKGSFARIVEAVLTARHLDHGQVLENMHAVGRAQIGRLERGLTALEIIAGVSPLIGLLGTVLGMIAVFDAITAQGMGNPQVLSDGISKALVTTVAGLSVAIPALATHSWLSKCVDDLANEMQERATGLLAKLEAQR